MKFLTRITAILVAATLSSSSVLKTPSSSDGNFELLILHNNDMHARFEQTSQLSGACTTADRDAGKCYGGFPRVAYVVKEARKAAASGQGPPVLYLNAGDTYTGTAWFTIYKWKIAAEFINALQPDAVSLGNNELQYGSNKLSAFLEKIETKILASNVILKTSEEIEKLQKSIIFDIKGVKVGLIGYLTPEAKILDSTGNIEYIDEIIALKEEVIKLKALDVNIIIALGHSNVDKDIEIAKEVDGIDLVIGGHKNTFFWNGTSAETNLLNIDETVTVTQQSGRQVPVIQSYAYDKYLGQLNVKFDADGEITDYKTEHILLDALVPQDPESLQIIEKYNKEIASMSEEVIGDTAVVLDGGSCKVQECNLGNLITDSIMYYYALEYDHESEGWTDASIAIIHGGAIATSISPSKRPASITRGDLLSVLPSESHIVTVTMKGTILLQAIEQSVADYDISNPSEQFLQFSGIRVVYDLSKDTGSRIISAVARCWSCEIPEFRTIDDSSDYKILMPSSLANTYPMFTELPKEDLAYDEITCVAEFIKLRTPIYPEVAGRISLLNVDDNNSATALRITTSIVFVTLITVFVF